MSECHSSPPWEQSFTREARKYIPSSLKNSGEKQGRREERETLPCREKWIFPTLFSLDLELTRRNQPTSLTTLLPPFFLRYMQEHGAVCPHHAFSFSTNPWSRSPGELKFGTPQLIMILAEGGNKAKRREEFFIPILIPAEQ